MELWQPLSSYQKAKIDLGGRWFGVKAEKISNHLKENEKCPNWHAVIKVWMIRIEVLWVQIALTEFLAILVRVGKGEVAVGEDDAHGDEDEEQDDRQE